jgi:preprotein translocase subunit Sss1
MQARSNNPLSRLDISERTVALSLGVLFLVLGIAGFIPAFMTLPVSAPTTHVDAPRLLFDDGYGYVFGLFPTNFLHNAVHIVVGLLGLAAATSLSGALTFNRGFAVAYAAIALMGLLHATNTTFGLMPIYGNNVWLNALGTLLAGYVGFIKPAAVQAEIKDVGAPTPSA